MRPQPASCSACAAEQGTVRSIPTLPLGRRAFNVHLRQVFPAHVLLPSLVVLDGSSEAWQKILAGSLVGRGEGRQIHGLPWLRWDKLEGEASALLQAGVCLKAAESQTSEQTPVFLGRGGV